MNYVDPALRAHDRSVAAPAVARRRLLNRHDVEKFLPNILTDLTEGEMDEHFPKKGTRSSPEFIQNVMKGHYAFDRGCRKLIVAQKSMIKFAKIGMFAFGERHPSNFGGGHTALSGPPGHGKTLLAVTLERLYEADTKRVQGTRDQMPADLIGSNLLHYDDDGKRSFKFHRGPLFTQYLIADEITRYSEAAQAAFLEVMSEGQVTGPDGIPIKNTPIVVATTNEDVRKLLKPLNDRFMFQVRLEPFTAAEFTEGLFRTQNFQKVQIEKVCDMDTVMKIRQFFHDHVDVSAEIRDFLGKFAETINSVDGLEILRPLREKLGFSDDDEFIEPGSKPLSLRSLPHVEGAARSLAASQYLDYVTFPHVREVLLPILRHRVNFTVNALGRGSRDMVRTELRKRFGGTGKSEMAEYLLVEICKAVRQHCGS
jgi:MoxR-like ATPase